MEPLHHELYLAKVVPILIEGKELVLELFQNLSGTYLKVNQEYHKLSSIVQKMNQLASIETFTNLYSHSFTNNKGYSTFSVGR